MIIYKYQYRLTSMLDLIVSDDQKLEQLMKDNNIRLNVDENHPHYAYIKRDIVLTMYYGNDINNLLCKNIFLN